MGVHNYSNNQYMIFEEGDNDEEIQKQKPANFRLRERMHRKKDIIIEEQEDSDDDAEKYSQDL